MPDGHEGATVETCICRWTEHDPQEIWDTVQTCTEKALAEAQRHHGSLDVKAVGITNQRETTVVWDRTTGKVLHNAIVWHDGRTADLCAKIEREQGSKVCCCCL